MIQLRRQTGEQLTATATGSAQITIPNGQYPLNGYCTVNLSGTGTRTVNITNNASRPILVLQANVIVAPKSTTNVSTGNTVTLMCLCMDVVSNVVSTS